MVCPTMAAPCCCCCCKVPALFTGVDDRKGCEAAIVMVCEGLEEVM